MWNICGFFGEFVTLCNMECIKVVNVICLIIKKRYWKAIACLMLDGLKVWYFLVPISLTFLISPLFGKFELTDDTLLESFKRYGSEGGEAYLTSILTQYNPESEENFMDTLDTCRCFQIFCNTDNLLEVLSELTHQEIIQHPMYVANSFCQVFKAVINFAFGSKDDLVEFSTKEN